MTPEQMLQLMCMTHRANFQLATLNSGWIELFDTTSLKRVTAPTIEGAIRAMYKEFES